MCSVGRGYLGGFRKYLLQGGIVQRGQVAKLDAADKAPVFPHVGVIEHNGYTASTAYLNLGAIAKSGGRFLNAFVGAQRHHEPTARTIADQTRPDMLLDDRKDPAAGGFIPRSADDARDPIIGNSGAVKSGALTNRAADCPFRGQRRSLQWLVADRQNRWISGMQELNCLAIKIDGLHHTAYFQLRGITPN